MRIAILQSTSPASISMSVYAQNIAESLRNVQPSWNIVEFSPKISAASKGSQLSHTVNKYYQRYWNYPRSFKVQEADIFHIVDHSDGHLVPWLKSFGKKTVVTCHDLINLVQPDLYQGLAIMPLISLNTWRWSVQKMKEADHIITVSAYTAGDVISELEVDPAMLTAIPNAVSSEFQPVTDEETVSFRQRHGVAPETFCILNVGSNNPRKNISRILDVMKQLQDQQQAVHFWKAGSDFNAEQYAFIAEHDLARQISYLGRPSALMLKTLYSAADALIAPSIYEGFGLTVLESMACGTPVITANTTSLPEVAGNAAVLVDPQDTEGMTKAVMRLQQDPTFRQQLIRAGLDRVKTFTWDRTAHQIANVYEHVASKKS